MRGGGIAHRYTDGTRRARPGNRGDLGSSRIYVSPLLHGCGPEFLVDPQGRTQDFERGIGHRSNY